METVNLDQGAKLSELADYLMAAKSAKSSAEEMLKNANFQIRQAEAAIYAAMQEQEIDKFAHNGQLFYPYVSAYPRATPGREDEYFTWLEEHGENGIIKRVIHPQTHRSWWKQHEDWHEELVTAGFVDAHEEIRIGVRAAK